MASDLQTYTSSCHCGQVRLQAKLPRLTETHICNCNCSICTKNGYLLVYPKREDVTFLSGEDNLTQYRFASKLKPHMFCKTCGTSMLMDFKETAEDWQNAYFGLNLRAFENIEDILPDLKPTPFDGKQKLDPPYQPAYGDGKIESG